MAACQSRRMSHRRAWLPLKSRCLRGPPRFAAQDAAAPQQPGHDALHGGQRQPRMLPVVQDMQLGRARPGVPLAQPADALRVLHRPLPARVRAGAAGLRRQPPQPLPAEPAPPFVVRRLPDPLTASPSGACSPPRPRSTSFNLRRRSCATGQSVASTRTLLTPTHPVCANLPMFRPPVLVKKTSLPEPAGRVTPPCRHFCPACGDPIQKVAMPPIWGYTPAHEDFGL